MGKLFSKGPSRLLTGFLASLLVAIFGSMAAIEFQGDVSSTERVEAP